MSEVLKTYKGFNKDMTCRGFQYEEGKEYETDVAECCESGFHACEKPLDVFRYYKPSKSVYHEVEQSGDLSKCSDDSKVASTKIKVGAKIGIEGLVKAQVDFVFEKIKMCRKKAEFDCDKESTATSGNGSSAATSGEESSAATSNKNGIALACGKNAKAKGVIGSYIVITEWNKNQDELIRAEMVRIDGENYKPYVWYKIENGKIVEAEDEY